MGIDILNTTNFNKQKNQIKGIPNSFNKRKNKM